MGLKNNVRNAKRKIAVIKSKQEIVILKELVDNLVYILGATKFEMERMLDEGAAPSENTELIKRHYSHLMSTLGIQSIDPREAANGG